MSEGTRLKKVINSYVLAQEDPNQRLKLLQRYLKVQGIADVSLEELRVHINRIDRTDSRNKRKDTMEALLFTKEGTPKKNRYGSSFCKNCHMYKDYEKECPYCGSLELTM